MIQTECRGCGQKLTLPDDMAGKRARCPSCGDPVKVPGAAPAVSSPERPRSGTPPPERPRAATPPPARSRYKTPSPRRPTSPAQPAPPSSENPFDFTNSNPPPPAASPAPTPRPSVTPPPVAQQAPPASTALVFSEPTSTPAVFGSTFRRSRSFARPFACYGAFIGAALAAIVLYLLAPGEDTMTEGLARLARGRLTVEHIRGGVVGLIGGLLIGAALVAVVGRSLPSIAVGCFLLIAGAVLGAVRQSVEGELSIMLLLAAAFGGVIVGAALGAMLGAAVDLLRK